MGQSSIVLQDIVVLSTSCFGKLLSDRLFVEPQSQLFFPSKYFVSNYGTIGILYHNFSQLIIGYINELCPVVLRNYKLQICQPLALSLSPTLWTKQTYETNSMALTERLDV